MEKSCKDCLGNEVFVGDSIVYVSSYGGWLTRGNVGQIFTRETIEVQQTKKVINNTKFIKYEKSYEN